MNARHEKILLSLQKNQPQNIDSISNSTELNRNWVSKSIKELQEILLINKIDTKDNRVKEFILSNKGFKIADLLKKIEDTLIEP